MIGVNRVVLHGNLATEPEEIANGKGCTFRIAYNTYGGKDKDEHSNFVSVKVWGGQAGPVKQYLSKGDPCIVEGRLVQERWEKDGTKQSQVVITADNVQFLGSKDD